VDNHKVQFPFGCGRFKIWSLRHSSRRLLKRTSWFGGELVVTTFTELMVESVSLDIACFVVGECSVVQLF